MAVAHAPSSRAEPLSEPVVNAPTRVLRDTVLFHRGESKKHLYLIEVGTVAIYDDRAGRNSVVEFAFSGDTIGFGFLDTHIHSAQAVGEARVRALPLSALDEVLLHDQRALQRYAEALQREFEFRRQGVLSADRKPANRLAALLVALSLQNGQEGRDSTVIVDSLDCGTVARYLEVDVATLGDALVELERRKLIERCPPHGLRIIDVVGLKKLADEVTD